MGEKNKRKIWFWFFILFALEIGNIKVGLANALELPDERTFLRAVADGYLNNRESFPFLKCRFLITTAEAGTIEDALDRRWTKPILSKNLWIVNGVKVFFSTECDRKILEKELSPKKLGDSPVGFLSCAPEKYLDNGSAQVGYSPLIPLATVRGPQKHKEGLVCTPFGMGIMGLNEEANPGHNIRKYLGKNLFCCFEGIKKINDIELIVVTIGLSEKNWEDKYFLDPKRGFLPLQTWRKAPDGKKLWLKNYVTAAKECSNGRWFPTCSILIWDPEDNGPFSVREFKVTDLDVDIPPDDKNFSFEIPNNTYVNDGVNMLTQFCLKNPRQVTLNNIIELYELCQATRLEAEEKMKKYHLQRENEKENGKNELTSSPVNFWLVILGILVLITFGFCTIRYGRKKRFPSRV